MRAAFLLRQRSELLFSYACAAHDEEEQDVKSTESDSFHGFFHSVRGTWRKTHRCRLVINEEFSENSNDRQIIWCHLVAINVDRSGTQPVRGDITFALEHNKTTKVTADVLLSWATTWAQFQFVLYRF